MADISPAKKQVQTMYNNNLYLHLFIQECINLLFDWELISSKILSTLLAA